MALVWIRSSYVSEPLEEPSRLVGGTLGSLERVLGLDEIQ